MIADEHAAAMSELAHCIARANGLIAARLATPITAIQLRAYTAFLRQVISTLEASAK